MRSNETNFIKRLQLGKEDALEFIVDKYLPLVKGVTHKILFPIKQDGVIEECINDVFLSIWNNANKFHGDATDFKKWVCAITKFKAIDYYRKATKRVELISEHVETSEAASIEDELIEREDRTELIRLINQMEPVDRDIFIMKYFLGLKSEEISARLGLTVASVHNRIYRGKKKLKQEITNFKMGGHLA